MTGFKSNNITDPKKKRVIYFTVVDNILSETNKRFNDNSDLLTAISSIQSDINFLNDFIIIFL